MSGAGSRRKGANFERLVRRWFEPGEGKDTRVTLLSHGHAGESEEDIRVAVDYASVEELFGDFGRFEALLSIECKNHKQWSLGTWWTQAVTQARARGAHAVLIVKRRGTQDPAEQWVIQSLEEWTAMIEEVAG